MTALELLELKIARLRYRGYGGTAIKPHRSIYSMSLDRRDLLIAVLLPLVFNFLLFVFLDQIVAMWRDILEFWLGRLMPGTPVTMHMVDLGSYVLWLPIPDLSAVNPGTMTWFGTLLVCILLWIATYFIPLERLLPFKYIIRACLLIQASALAFFYVIPDLFPYDLVSYIGDALTMGFFFIFMIPWILGLTYNVFSFSLLQKTTLTAITIAYFLVALPMQYLLHAWLLHHASLLFLPICYLVFGIFMDVMMFVAFYSWGMTWRFKAPRE